VFLGGDRGFSPALSTVVVGHWAQNGKYTEEHVSGKHHNAFIYDKSHEEPRDSMSTSLKQQIIETLSFDGQTVLDTTSVAGSMGATAKVVYKRIASLIADKHNKPYSKTMNWLRCRLSFSLLRSAVMCLHGSRSSLHHPISSFHGEIDLAIAELEGQGSF